MIGKVAKCKRGKLGIIVKSKVMPADSDDPTVDTVYYGIGFDGARWQSKHPEVIADSVDEYIATIRKPLKTVIGIR